MVGRPRTNPGDPSYFTVLPTVRECSTQNYLGGYKICGHLQSRFGNAPAIRASGDGQWGSGGKAYDRLVEWSSGSMLARWSAMVRSLPLMVRNNSQSICNPWSDAPIKCTCEQKKQTFHTSICNSGHVDCRNQILVDETNEDMTTRMLGPTNLLNANVIPL